jgi:hypothetical protein
MNVIEILNRPSPSHYTVEELEFVIADYIFKKKGQRIKVNIYKNADLSMHYLNPFGRVKMEAEYKNLFLALEIIQKDYYKNNNDIKN